MEKQLLTKLSLQNLLAELSARASDFATVYADAAAFPTRMDTLLATPAANFNEIKESVKTETVTREAEKYRTGAAIFWDGPGSRYIVLPPFPVPSNAVVIGELDTAPLFEIWERKHVIGVVLVAWGSYGIGVFNGDRLVASKVGTGYIHQKQKQGGSSQKRFARRTEEQKKAFLKRVANRTEEILRTHRLDYIFFGGNRLIRKPLLDECKYLQGQADKISGRVLEVRHANQAVLEHSRFEIMKAAVFSF
ncbi:MAG: Vms1/Ankzf1 family peptidyl-tRNA hydrolase [Chloroflexota bacterium]|nr:Vms1/Ankzf1 family peptidyl-tRNA hydrolase [Chloroflexota bacterium]